MVLEGSNDVPQKINEFTATDGVVKLCSRSLDWCKYMMLTNVSGNTEIVGRVRISAIPTV